jgi:hypothetical protein
MQWLQIFTEVVGHFFATQIGSRQFAHRRRSDATFGFGMSATRRQTTQTRSLIAPCIARPPAKWPRCRRTADKPNELTSPHGTSIEGRA